MVGVFLFVPHPTGPRPGRNPMWAWVLIRYESSPLYLILQGLTRTPFCPVLIPGDPCWT